MVPNGLLRNRGSVHRGDAEAQRFRGERIGLSWLMAFATLRVCMNFLPTSMVCFCVKPAVTYELEIPAIMPLRASSVSLRLRGEKTTSDG